MEILERCREFHSLWFCCKMETVYLRNVREVTKYRKELEKKLNVKIEIRGRKVVLDGDTVDEYDALQVFEAIGFGFSVNRALALTEEDVVFRKIHIKNHTKRSLRSVLGRLIGTYGKTRKTISEISGCDILVKGGEAGIIGDAERVEDVERAIIHLIEGSKQSNMYRFLERMNRERKEKLDLN